MKKIYLFLTFIALSTVAIAQNNKAYQLMKRASDLVDFKSISMNISLETVAPNGSVRVREIESSTLSAPGVTKMVTKIVAPADQRGITMLIHDYEEKADEMWIYLPSLRRSRRVAGSEKGGQFMGSEFLNSDMSRPNLNDFNHTLKGEEMVDGKKHYLVESVTKDATVARELGYNKKISYITEEDGLCRKVEYFGRGDNLTRTQLITRFEKGDGGAYIATDMEVTNHRNRRRSTLKIVVDKNRPTASSSLFDPSSLH